MSVVSRFIKYALCAASDSCLMLDYVRVINFRIIYILYYIIFSVISVLLTTENSDDLEIRVPDRSRSLKVTSVN